MSRKKRRFEIAPPPAEPAPPAAPPDLETKSAVPFGPPGPPFASPLAAPERRRSPMAAAIAESAEAARARAATEARIRAENDALAETHIDLLRRGLVAEPVPLHAIRAARLHRDRLAAPDADLAELVASIRAVGLSNPIRLERVGEGAYELVQGWRRLEAYRALAAEEGAAWERIPALVTEPGESLAESYRRMVDENLVRKDISFAEMAMLARAVAAEPALACADAHAAVDLLFASAAKQKRSYIRGFVELLERLGPHLAHPQALPRNLGLALRRRLSRPAPGAPGLPELAAALAAAPDRDAEAELALLRAFVGEGGEGPPEAPEPAETPAETPAEERGARPAGGPLRETRRLAVAVPAGTVGVRLAPGRLALSLPEGADLSGVPEARLAAAVAAFLAALED